MKWMTTELILITDNVSKSIFWNELGEAQWFLMFFSSETKLDMCWGTIYFRFYDKAQDVFWIPVFVLFLLHNFSTFLLFLLFLFLCFSAFPVSLLFCFSASPLFCFSIFTLPKMKVEGGVVLKIYFNFSFFRSWFLNDQQSASFHVICKQMRIKYLRLAPEELSTCQTAAAYIQGLHPSKNCAAIITPVLSSSGAQRQYFN